MCAVHCVLYYDCTVHKLYITHIEPSHCSSEIMHVLCNRWANCVLRPPGSEIYMEYWYIYIDIYRDPGRCRGHKNLIIDLSYWYPFGRPNILCTFNIICTVYCILYIVQCKEYIMHRTFGTSYIYALYGVQWMYAVHGTSVCSTHVHVYINKLIHF